MDANHDSGIEARRIIGSRWPAVGAALEKASAGTDGLPELQLDTGGPVPTLCAGEIRLASAWAPEREAQLQCSVVNPLVNQVTLFGVGMGYLPPLLLEQLPVDGTLTVVPMNLALLDRILPLIDMTPWLVSNQVELRLPDSYDKLPVNAVVTPPMLHFAEPSAEPVRDWLLQKLSDSYVVNHQQSNSDVIQCNIAFHLQHHMQDEDVGVAIEQLKRNHAKQAANDPEYNAVVIGAGPSLDFSAPQIKALQQDGAVTIAVDAALSTLLNKDIVPDYVVCIDPLDYVTRLFDVDHERLSATSLIYFPSANSDVVAAWRHRRYSAIGGHSRFEHYSRSKPSTILFSSGSVIHPAVDLAVRSGAGNVYLAGADFGFPFELTHASDSPFAADRKTVYAEGQTVRNYQGEEMPSQINFISYFRDLENYIGNQVVRGVHFFNLGHYSAKIRHVSCVPLAA